MSTQPVPREQDHERGPRQWCKNWASSVVCLAIRILVVVPVFSQSLRDCIVKFSWTIHTHSLYHQKQRQKLSFDLSNNWISLSIIWRIMVSCDDHSIAPRLASRSAAKNTGLTYVSSADKLQRCWWLVRGRTFSNLIKETSYIQHWGEFKNLLFYTTVE